MINFLIKKTNEYKGVILFAIAIFICLQCMNYNAKIISEQENNQAYTVEKR